MKSKSIRLKSATFCAVAVLAFLPKAENLGGLKDVSNPHLGFYQCESATLGQEDLTEFFDFVRVELTKDGKMILSFKDKFGRKGEYVLNYEYDREKGEITLLSPGEGKRTFPFKDGEWTISIPYGEKLFHAKFTR
jgi:hypothetical protein